MNVDLQNLFFNFVINVILKKLNYKCVAEKWLLYDPRFTGSISVVPLGWMGKTGAVNSLQYRNRTALPKRELFRVDRITIVLVNI